MSESQNTAPSSANTLSPTLLALLCCPLCPERPPLHLASDNPNRLVCDRRGHLFPIHDGLPDLRPESGSLPADSGAGSTQATSDMASDPE